MGQILWKVLLLGCIWLPASWAQTQYTGEIDGASYIIDVPDQASGDLLLIARGFRPDFFPLSAVYEDDTDFYQTLTAEGWIIASTSFRSNQWVVAEGGADILALRRFVHKEIHPVRRAIVYGETMGGGVGVWLAENEADAIDGIFALGAHLFPQPGPDGLQQTELASVFSGQPNLPIMFLANGDEMASAGIYQQTVDPSEALKPVTRWVNRTGHVNVNSAERLAAMRALLGWLEGEPAESLADATISLAPKSVAALNADVAAGNIRRIRPLYGNVYTSLVDSDLAYLNLELGDVFELVHRQQRVDVTYAQSYSDVPYGAWVAFFDSEGFLQISRNYANAAETLGAQKGDAIMVQRKD